MKKFSLLLLLAAALCACTQSAPLDNGSSLPLSQGWTLSRSGGPEKVAATVPSTVAGSLYATGFYGDDLLEARNYEKVDKSIFDDEWVYTTEFAAKPGEGQHAELVFDGLNYRADIFLNGTQLAASDTTYGVFIRRSYDVGSLLKGRNKLEVRLRRAQKGDLNIGFVDWNPRPLDESMGIVRPVTLHTTGAVAIEDVFVVPDLEVEHYAYADLAVSVKLRNLEAHPVEGDLEIQLQGADKFTVPVKLEAGEATTVLLTPAEAAQLHIVNPRVWWSYDLGTPELYDLTAHVTVAGAVSDKRSVTFGVRKIESRLTGKNYRQFTLNGKDILIKGAGWTDDIFLLDTEASLAQQVSYVKDMNLNLIRFENIWGKDDTIYDICDQEGVLALVGWSCQWEWEDYCGLPEVGSYGCINGPEVENLAVRYFHDQVVRLHNHPAVIAWMTGSDRIPNPGVEERYMAIFAQEDYRPYICSAKSLKSLAGWSGSKMEGPYEYVAPDYWYFDKNAGGAFGFNTETGIGANLPQMESLKKMIPAEGLWPMSSDWDYHCTASASAMNNLNVLTKAITEQYGAPADLEDFVRKGHAVDYAGTRAMFEAFRVRMPESTGIVQWMLNSAWPSMYWQLYDWYGVPTAGYYGTKKACEPDQLIFDYATRKVYAVSERPEEQELTATMTVYDAESKIIGEEGRTFKTSYRSVVPVFDLRRYDGKPHFVMLAIVSPEGTPLVENFYAIGAKDNVYDYAKTNWYITPITQWSDLHFVFARPAENVALDWEVTDECCEVTVENRSDYVVPQVILKALDAQGNLAVPAYWSDNFFALAPGQVKTVTCLTPVENPDITLSF